MIGEVLGGSCFVLMAVKLYFGYTKPKHYEFPVKFGDHSNYHSFMNAFDGIKQNLMVVSEPMAKLFGINLLNNNLLLDAEHARKFLMTDKAQSHYEMSGFFDLCFQYRELRGDRGAGKMNIKELGVMSDMDPNNPKTTNVMKQARKRFLEFTSSPAQAETNLDRIQREGQALVEVALELGEKGTVAFDPKKIAMDAATNTGVATATGFSFKQGTKELRDMALWVDRNLYEIVAPHPTKLFFMLLPRWLRSLIPLRFWPEFLPAVNPFWDYLMELVDDHEKNYDPEDTPRNLLDTMARDYKSGIFSFSDMVATVYSMIVAAADTTSESTTLVWLSLARHPEWQQKCYEEARDKNFMAERMVDMPLIAAFIHETMRWNPVLHRSLFHTSTVPVEIDGYKFSPGSIFSVSTAAFAMSEKYFKDPYKFDPMRFIEDGKFVPNKNLMPFGYGRRSCPGKALALQQLLQYTIEFLRNCEAAIDPKNPLPVAKNEEEWHAMFDRLPVTDPTSALMKMKHHLMLVKPRVHS